MRMESMIHAEIKVIRVNKSDQEEYMLEKMTLFFLCMCCISNYFLGRYFDQVFIIFLKLITKHNF